MPSDELQSKRLELEIERLKSEIILNEAHTKKLASRGIGRLVLIALGVLVSVWTFAATFTGFLTDLSQITKAELPKAKAQLATISEQNDSLQAIIRLLRPQKARADSLDAALRRVKPKLFELVASHEESSVDAVSLREGLPWLSSILLIEIEGWQGPLIVALQDEITGIGRPFAAGYRYDTLSFDGRAFYGTWSPDSYGFRIDENVGGVLVGDSSVIFIDVTSTLPDGSFVARWESHKGRGKGSARRLGHLTAY